MSAAAPSRIAMKSLAGGLFLVCAGLFLLAVEQKHAVAAWQALRDGSGPAVRGAMAGVGRLPDVAVEGGERVRTAFVHQAAVLRARQTAAPEGPPPVIPVLRTRQPLPTAPAGPLTLVGAELRFGEGDVLNTRPLRIAHGRDVFAPGQTFASRLGLPAEAQIELREVTTPAPSRLCDGDAPAAAALSFRGDQVDLMLFRVRDIGPATPPAALCGAWSVPIR